MAQRACISTAGLDADDGTVLAALFGVDRVLGVDQLPGRATLTADGPLNSDIRVDGELAGSGLERQSAARCSCMATAAPKATVQVLATAADLRPLQQAMTGQAGDAVPVSARAAVAVSGTDLSLTQIAVAAGKASANGQLTLNLASPVAIDGDITADNVDGARVVAMLLGLPRQAPGTAGLWSGQPVGAGAFAADERRRDIQFRPCGVHAGADGERSQRRRAVSPVRNRLRQSRRSSGRRPSQAAKCHCAAMPMVSSATVMSN